MNILLLHSLFFLAESARNKKKKESCQDVLNISVLKLHKELARLKIGLNNIYIYIYSGLSHLTTAEARRCVL